MGRGSWLFLMVCLLLNSSFIWLILQSFPKYFRILIWRLSVTCDLCLMVCLLMKWSYIWVTLMSFPKNQHNGKFNLWEIFHQNINLIRKEGLGTLSNIFDDLVCIQCFDLAECMSSAGAKNLKSQKLCCDNRPSWSRWLRLKPQFKNVCLPTARLAELRAHVYQTSDVSKNNNPPGQRKTDFYHEDFSLLFWMNIGWSISDQK